MQDSSVLASRPWYVSLIFALIAVTLLLGGVWLYARIQNPFPYYGTSYTPPQPAAAFSGTDQDGNAYAFAPQGKTTALFFGFTHCPNICPLTLTYLDKVRSRLSPAQQKDFQVLFISIDPERDTPAQLKNYVGFFNTAPDAKRPDSKMLGVNVPEPGLAAVARSYGAGYSKADTGSSGDYQMNHTTATYLIDRSGKLRLLWDYTQLSKLERVQADIQEVMR